MSNDTATTESAAGVQDLIDRLKSDGVSRGKAEAETLIADARKQSMTIVDNAKTEAEQILAKARQEAHQIEQNGRQALGLASRDATLKLKESFQHEFQQRFGKLVSQTMSDPEFLRRLILEVAQRSVPNQGNEPMHVLLPPSQADQASLSGTMYDAPQGSLAHFVLGLTGDMLRDGVTFGVAETGTNGVRVRLAEKDVEIDLTDQTVTALLMRFLAPRFRAIIDSGK